MLHRVKKSVFLTILIMFSVSVLFSKDEYKVYGRMEFGGMWVSGTLFSGTGIKQLSPPDGTEYIVQPPWGFMDDDGNILKGGNKTVKVILIPPSSHAKVKSEIGFNGIEVGRLLKMNSKDRVDIEVINLDAGRLVYKAENILEFTNVLESNNYRENRYIWNFYDSETKELIKTIKFISR